MSKPKSEIIGQIVCPFCLSLALVRQSPGKNYKFISCPVDKVIQSTGYAKARGYQDYIDDHMEPITPAIEGEVISEIITDEPLSDIDREKVEVIESEVKPLKTFEPEQIEAPAASFAFPWED